MTLVGAALPEVAVTKMSVRIASARPRRQRPRNGIVAIQALVCFLISAGGALYIHGGDASSVYTLSWALTVASVWALCSWWLVMGTLFDPYGMFMVSLSLFNGGQALLEAGGLNERGILGGVLDDDVVTATLYMVLLALCFTHLGAILSVRRSNTIAHDTLDCDDVKGLRITGWILMSISLIPTCFILWAAASTVASGGYLAAYQGDADAGLAATPQVLSLFIVPAALFLLAGANGRRREKMTAMIVIAVSTVVQFSLGFRGAAVTPACAFLWLWSRCEGKIRTPWLVGAVAALIIAIPISRETRLLAGSDRLSLDTLASAYQSIDNPVVSAVTEMGGSMATVAYTYILVPSTRALDYGGGYAYAALTVLPNLFWSVHPTIAHGQASDWLIRTVDPSQAMLGVGLGYSCIAEAYLNFGWIGVPIIMILLGFAVGRLAALGAAGRRRDLAMVAAITSFLLKFPRGETSTLVRTVFWYALLPYALTVVVGILNERRITPMHSANVAQTPRLRG